MGPLPDLTCLFWFALIGIVATCLTIATALGWAGYHLYRALALYLGG